MISTLEKRVYVKACEFGTATDLLTGSTAGCVRMRTSRTERMRSSSCSACEQWDFQSVTELSLSSVNTGRRIVCIYTMKLLLGLSKLIFAKHLVPRTDQELCKFDKLPATEKTSPLTVFQRLQFWEADIPTLC